MTDSYQLLRTSSSASDFHQRQIVEPVQPQIWWHEVTRPALVLGSTQHREVVDYEACAANEVEVVRRRSGGGAVLLIPGDVTWVDVVLPAGAPGWASDVHAPMVWLGRILADALSDLLPGTDQDHEITVHDGKIVTTKWSPLVCFDGIGAGEVLLGENKLIGISQRRTRTSARLQCCWYSSYDPKSLVSLLLPGRRPPISDLRSVATLARSVASRIPETLLARLNQQR